MAETTPLLLPRAYSVSHHIPSFLRVCHSPWPFLGQQALLALRATFAVFLSIVFILDIPYGINHSRRGKQLAFEASNVSLIIQICYYWTTTSWTLQHILAPDGRLPPEKQAKGKFLAQTQALFSAPTSTDNNSKERFVFSTFYNASVTFPFIVSIAYWLVVYPSEPVLDQGSKGERLHHFVLISITVLNSVIAFLEVMVLSSVRKQKDLATQIAGVIAIYLLYGIWTVFGHSVTGEYVYKYFDPDYAGWRGVATTDIFILSLTVTVFFAQRGLHALREILAWKAECDLSGRRERLTAPSCPHH